MTEFSNKNVKELLRAELALFSRTITSDNENRILTFCRTKHTANPLHVVVIASDLARCQSSQHVSQRLDLLLQPDTVQLFAVLIESIREDFEGCDVAHADSLTVRLLRLVFASRNGLSETELLEVIPQMHWNFLSPLLLAFQERHILAYRCNIPSISCSC